MGIVVNAAKDVGAQVSQATTKGVGHGVKCPLHMVAKPDSNNQLGSNVGLINECGTALGDFDKMALNASVISLLVTPASVGGKIALNSTLAAKVGLSTLVAYGAIRQVSNSQENGYSSYSQATGVNQDHCDEGNYRYGNEYESQCS